MASLVLSDCDIYLNDVDMTGYTNEISLSPEVEMLDVSTFDSAGWREFIAGPARAAFTVGGPWGFEDPDDELWTHLTTTQTDPVLTWSSTSTAGDVAYFGKVQGFDRQHGGSYGEAASWQLTGQFSGKGTTTPIGLFRGGLSLVKQTITGAVNGTAINLPLFSGDATDELAVVVHCFVDNGTSLDVIIERDDNSGFTTATTVDTISVTGVGTYWDNSVGLLLGSDTYYRVRTANLVGTSFTIAAVIGHGRVDP